MTDTVKNMWEIRPARPNDSSHIAKLEEDHPDSGAFSVSFRYRVDALAAQQALRPGSVCLVATVDDRIVAMGSYAPSMGRVGHEMRYVGMIYGLVVHSQFRMRGIGSSVYAALVERIRSAGGPGAVVVAGAQAENEGSVRAARKWATQAIRGRTRVLFRAGRRRAPRLPGGLAVREALRTDWAAISDGLNSCYDDYELAPIWDEVGLRDLYEASPFGERIRGYLVATDEEDRIIAGIGGLFDGSVETGHFEQLPLPIRILNGVFHLLPRDGILRRVVCRDAWYSRDASRGAEALTALWTSAPWVWRNQGNNYMLFTDPEGHVSHAIRRRGLVPGRGGWLMVASEPALDLSRPLWLPM